MREERERGLQWSAGKRRGGYFRDHPYIHPLQFSSSFSAAMQQVLLMITIFFCHAFSLMLYSFPQDLVKLTLYVYDASRTPWNMLEQVQVLHTFVSQFGVHVLLDNAYQ